LSSRQHTTAAPVNSAVQLANVNFFQQLRDRVDAGSPQYEEAGPQRGPRRLIGYTWHGLLGSRLQSCDALWAREIFGGDMERVNVSPGGIGEPGPGIVLVAVQGGRRPWSVVGGQDVFEEVGRRRGPNGL
jgi:hypothetical protein